MRWVDFERIKDMRCVICKGHDIQMKMVEEEIKVGGDISIAPYGGFSLPPLRRKIL